MPRRQLSIFQDAVHGTIDFSDPTLFSCDDALHQLLQSPNMQRLHRLRQIPFGSSSFIAATHTRFAHAVGTAHVAHRLLQRLQRVGYFDAQVVASLREASPGLAAECRTDDDLVRRTAEHVIISGLLQDVGELPHKPSTGLFLYPHAGVSSRLEVDLDIQVHGLTGKEIFTLSGIADMFQNTPTLRDVLDPGLLAYFIAGRAPSGIRESTALKALRHIIDGVVDADRLDYVHRDAYHTIGVNVASSAGQVIDSLIGYDTDGPIFNSSGPVSNFMMLRAILRSQAYSSPDVRFRDTLLAVALSQLLRRHPQWMSDYFNAPHGALTTEAFMRLDDVTLFESLRRLRGDGKFDTLEVGAVRALDELFSPSAQYQYAWLDRPAEQSPEPSAIQLKPDVYVDTYWDYEAHRLYRPGSVRVAGTKYSTSDLPVALEGTAGHVSDFLQMLWDTPPVQNKVLYFVPQSRMAWFASTAQSGAAERLGLYRAAVAKDAEIRLSVVDDTRAEPMHTGPAIFVSFCWEDVDAMRAVLRLLYERRSRYFAFVDDYHGLGGNTKKNGYSYAAQSDAAIILLSRAYAERSFDPTGNIYPELISLGRRLPPERIVPISLDAKADYRGALEKFPWALIGYDEPPFLGAPIRNAATSKIARAVEAALARISSAPPIEDHEAGSPAEPLR